MLQVLGLTSSHPRMKYRYSLYVTLVTLSALLLYLLKHTPTHLGQTVGGGKERHKPRISATNSTLGFEAILALSSRSSWRTRGLRAAASLTDIDITIPIQPKNSNDLIQAFEKLGSDRGQITPQHGSAVAWFAHLDLLKFVIASGFSTALIVEDDVDWDVDLKKQLQLVSDNVRAYMDVSETDMSPYGRAWDILWLGHCGSAIYPDEIRILTYTDDTRCRNELYSGWSRQFLRAHLPNGYRNVQNSTMTVCTFAYAVTAESGPKVLQLLSGGADEAFDVALSRACRDGRLECVVVNPQLMNHYEPPKDSGYVSLVHEGDGQGQSQNETSFESVKGTTGNIMKSARCKALYNDSCMRPPSDI